MPSVTYTASRSLISGHSSGLSYSIDLRIAARTPRTKREGREHKSLSGNKEYFLHRLEKFFSLQSAMLTQAELDQYIEFLDSVAGGESFTFDAYGTVASPDNPQLATLDGDYSVSQASTVPHYRVTFTVTT